MRKLTNSLAGGVLAALLVLSASPAQAFGPQDTAPETEQNLADSDPAADADATAGADGAETPIDGTDDVDGTAGAEASGGADGTAEGKETPDPTGPATEDPAAPEDPEAPVNEPAAGDPASDEAEEPATDDAAPTPDETKTVTKVPDTIALNGRLVLLPNEPNPAFAFNEGSEASVDGDGLIGSVLIATENGQFVPVDSASIAAPISSDAEFTGTATLPESARVAVAQQLNAEGSLSEDQVLGTVNQAVTAAEEELQVDGTVTLPVEAAAMTDAPLGAAPAKRAHTADVFFFSGGRNFTEGQLKNLVNQAGSYWKTQSNGAVNGLKINRFKKRTPKKVFNNWECFQNDLWGQAAEYFGANANTYTNGHHLIVFVDKADATGHGGCGLAGLAGIGTNIHAGGEIWVDLGSWSKFSNPASQATQALANKSLSTLSHEAGHNLSLGHSQSRVCSGRTVDARTIWQDDEQNPGILRVLKPVGSTCKDVEYGNTWDIMGTGPGDTKPISLGLAHRTALGVNPSGSVRTVQAKSGRVQNFTLNPMGNNAGLRGLKISNPLGESFYVEYRNTVGQDSQGLNSQSPMLSYDRITAVTTGVVLSKSYPTSQIKWSDDSWRPYAAKRSSALTYYKTAGSYPNRKHLAMAKAGVSTPVSSVARVRVTNIAGGKANVRVEFTPFIDVTYDYKFGKEINWMSSAKLSTGINAGSGLRKYAPKDKVTREAMAAFLYRLNAPKNYQAPKRSPFVDMKPGDKFYKEISWMYTSKLSTGIKTSRGKVYAPKAGVTREAMAAFIYRMDKAKKPATPKTSPFADMTPRTKFYKEIAWMYTTGLSTGVKQKSGKPKYLPKANVTREAMAAFIYRLKH